jgi:prophage DNA circulation protein
MTVLDELGNRLNETRQEVDTVVENLRNFSEITNTLESTDKSLKSSSDKLGSLAETLDENAQGFRDCVDSLQEATQLLKQIDPARIEGAINEIGQRVQELSTNIDNATSRAKEHTEGIKNRINALLILIVIIGIGVLIF